MKSYYRSPKVELYLESSIESFDIIPDVLLLMSERRRWDGREQYVWVCGEDNSLSKGDCH